MSRWLTRTASLSVLLLAACGCSRMNLGVIDETLQTSALNTTYTPFYIEYGKDFDLTGGQHNFEIARNWYDSLDRYRTEIYRANSAVESLGSPIQTLWINADSSFQSVYISKEPNSVGLQEIMDWQLPVPELIYKGAGIWHPGTLPSTELTILDTIADESYPIVDPGDIPALTETERIQLVGTETVLGTNSDVYDINLSYSGADKVKVTEALQGYRVSIDPNSGMKMKIKKSYGGGETQTITATVLHVGITDTAKIDTTPSYESSLPTMRIQSRSPLNLGGDADDYPGIDSIEVVSDSSVEGFEFAPPELISVTNSTNELRLGEPNNNGWLVTQAVTNTDGASIIVIHAPDNKKLPVGLEYYWRPSNESTSSDWIVGSNRPFSEKGHLYLGGGEAADRYTANVPQSVDWHDEAALYSYFFAVPRSNDIMSSFLINGLEKSAARAFVELYLANDTPVIP